MQESQRKWQADLRLRERDLMVLSWMCEQYAARVDHLAALTGTGRTTGERIGARLHAAGLARRVRVLVSQPTWVIPTAKGLFVCGLRYRLWKPKLATLTHVGAMNDVRLHIQAQKPESEWLSERQLVAEAKDQGGTRRHVPDGVLLAEGHRVAIEVELNVKNPPRLEAILDDLTGRFEGILYYCAPGPHRKLKQLEESGRWRSLGVRELPRQTGLEWL